MTSEQAAPPWPSCRPKTTLLPAPQQGERPPQGPPLRQDRREPELAQNSGRFCCFPPRFLKGPGTGAWRWTELYLCTRTQTQTWMTQTEAGAAADTAQAETCGRGDDTGSLSARTHRQDVQQRDTGLHRAAVRPPGTCVSLRRDPRPTAPGGGRQLVSQAAVLRRSVITAPSRLSGVLRPVVTAPCDDVSQPLGRLHQRLGPRARGRHQVVRDKPECRLGL